MRTQGVFAAEVAVENMLQILSGYAYTLVLETKVRFLAVHP